MRSHAWTVVKPCGAVVAFASVAAFDGYVREARRLGAVLSFTTPWRCVVERFV